MEKDLVDECLVLANGIEYIRNYHNKLCKVQIITVKLVCPCMLSIARA